MRRILQKVDHFFCNNWCLAVLDLTKGRWLVDSKHIAYLKSENASGRHIIIQPALELESYYMLVDDIDVALLQRHHQINATIWKPGRLVIETSPGNYQVWIHSSRPLDIREKTYWLKKLQSDSGASPKHRWGRCPGFFNRKPKYRQSNGHYPLAKLIWVDWNTKAVVPFVTLKKRVAAKAGTQKSFPLIPRGGVCHLCRSSYYRGNESATDFAYALALARRKVPKDEIKNRLIAERTNWENHFGNKRRECYLERTVKKAIRIVRNDI